MLQKFTTSLVTTIIAAFAMVGCAQNTSPSNDKLIVYAPIEPDLPLAPASDPASILQSLPAITIAQNQIASDGTVAEFIADSTGLSDQAFTVIANLSESAAKAKLVEIVGYCDKKDGGKNAKQIALSRAAAVRDELIKLGVQARKIRMKYVTTETRNTVVVILK